MKNIICQVKYWGIYSERGLSIERGGCAVVLVNIEGVQRVLQDNIDKFCICEIIGLYIGFYPCIRIGFNIEGAEYGLSLRFLELLCESSLSEGLLKEEEIIL